MKKFADLGLSPKTLAAIAKKGFETPTEIQAKTIPLLLEAKNDVLAQAQTGTGKTATFGLVFTEKLQVQKSKKPQALVLAPTRELAVQVAEEINSLKGENRLKIVPIYGGQSFGMQKKHLRMGVDIVVGTPGRIMDHMNQKTLDLSEVKYFVLDEADEMLNMGFIDDIKEISASVNPKRQMLLFSATMPKRIADLSKQFMKNLVQIKTQKDRITNNNVSQIYYEVNERDKFEALCRIMDVEEDFYGIIFCRTKVKCESLNTQLQNRGYNAGTLHGDIPQNRRQQVLREFKRKDTEVLVATDVAARGIDINDLSHVINYALPQNSESYVHRIGRTGRAGKDGKAITLITPSEFRKLQMYQRAAKANIEKGSLPNAKSMVKFHQQRMVDEILETAGQKKAIAPYVKIIDTLFANQDPKEILAAVLKQHYEAKLNPRAYKDIENPKSRGRDRNERRTTRRDRPEKSFSDEGNGHTRLFLTIGRKDGITPPKMLRMIEDNFKVSGRKVGDIDIMDSYTFVSVPLKEAEQILDAFNAMKHENPPVRVEKASPAPSRRKSGGRFKRGRR